MNENLIRVIVYIGCFCVCFMTLSWIDFSRFMQPSKSKYGVFLLFIFSMALAYLVAQFLMGLQIR